MPQSPATPNPRRRWRRLAATVLAAFAILTVALVVGGPPILGLVVAAALGPVVGGEVSIRSVHPADLGGQWVLERLVVRAPGWEGPAGEVIEIDRAVAIVDRAALWKGELRLLELAIDGMNVRLAEDPSRPGEVNVLALKPEAADGGAATWPSIGVLGLRLESGEADGETWSETGSRWFAGSVITLPEALDRHELALVETDADGRPLSGSDSALLLKGYFDTATLEAMLQVQSLDLGPDSLRIAPPSVRAWCRELELAGRVSSFSVQWKPSEPFDAILDIESLAFRLPDLGGEPWVRFRAGGIESAVRPPLMQVQSGRIEISEERLALTGLAGSLGGDDAATVPLPFEMDFRVDLAGGIGEPLNTQTFDRLAQASAFSLDLSVRGFENIAVPIATTGSGEPSPSDAGAADAIDLPLVAGRILENLGAISWRMEIDVSLERGPPLAFEDGVPKAAELQRSGKLMLSGGEGAYYRFPYPLEQVSGYLTFEGEVVEIATLRGKGPTGADILIRGTLLIPEDDTAVDITISSPNVPIDRHLVSALDDGPSLLLKTLFDEAAAERFQALGLLSTPESIRELERERTRLETELRALDPEAPSRIERAERLANLERRIAAGPFSLGGRVGLDLRIEQGLGKNAPLHTTGSIEFARCGLMLEGFPYPIVATGGRIDLEDERIGFAGGSLPFIAPGGGVGRISGDILIPRRGGERGFEPRLEIVAADDFANPAMLAAIDPPEWIVRYLPPDTSIPRGWADLLDAEGRVSMHGRVTPDATGALEPDWEFVAKVEGWTVSPKPPLAAAILELGAVWPSGLAAGDLRGAIVLEPGLVEFEDLAFEFEQAGAPARLSATGTIHPRDSTLEIEIDATSLDAATWVAATDATDPEDPSIFSRRNVDGRLDVELRASRTPEEFRREVEIVGGSVSIDGGWIGEPAPPRIDLELVSGTAGFVGDSTVLAGALLRISRAGPEGELPEGEVRFDGTRSNDDAPWTLRCEWRDGDLAGAATQLAIADFLPEIRDAWLLLAPQGRFGLDVDLDPSRGDLGRLAVSAERASVELDGARMSISSRIPTPIEIRPRKVIVGRSEVRLGDGEDAATLDASATFEREAPRRLSLLGSLSMPHLPSPALDALPAGIRTTLDSLSLASEGPAAVKDLALECVWHADDPPESPSNLEAQGSIRVERASFEAGVEFREVDATAALRATRTPERPLTLEAAIHANRAVMLDRELVDADATLRFDESLGRLVAAPIAARLYGGFLEGEVVADLARRRYRVSLLTDEVDAGLLIGGIPEDGEPTPQGGGLMRGRLALEGDFVESSSAPSRIGRGRVRIEDGSLAKDPISMSVLQLSQLSLPINDAIADADLRFFIEGDRLVLESVDLSCDTLRLAGDGEVDLDEMTIRSRFTAKGTVPGVSDLLAPIAGLLYAIDLDGPLADPKASMHPLPGLAPPARQPSTLDRLGLAGDPP
jgi:hypothetical protein